MLRVVLNQLWRHYPAKQQLFYHLLPSLEGQYMIQILVEVKTNSSATFFNGCQHIDTLVLDAQQVLTYISSVQTPDAV